MELNFDDLVEPGDRGPTMAELDQAARILTEPRVAAALDVMRRAAAAGAFDDLPARIPPRTTPTTPKD